MKPRYIVIALIMLAIGLGTGFWWGQRKATEIATATTAATGKAPERKILYYRNPMGLPDTSPVPKKDPMGMDYVPVYEGDAPAVNTPADQVAINVRRSRASCSKKKRCRACVSCRARRCIRSPILAACG